MKLPKYFLLLPTLLLGGFVFPSQATYIMHKYYSSQINGWRVTEINVSHTVIEKMCQASTTVNDHSVVLALLDKSYPFGQLHLTVYTHDRRIPQGYRGSAKLFLDGGDTALGKMLDYSTGSGDARFIYSQYVAFYMSGGILQKFKQAKHLTITGTRVPNQSFVIEDNMFPIISELEKCLQS